MMDVLVDTSVVIFQEQSHVEMGDYFVVYCIVMFEALRCCLFIKGSWPVCRCSRYSCIYTVHMSYTLQVWWYSTL